MALPGKIIMLALGCVILAYGMTIVIKSDAGTGPNDLVAIVISDKLRQKFSIIRIIVDVCFVAVGWLLGGPVGIGTLISTLGAGAVMQAVYAAFRFEPRAIRQRSIREVARAFVRGA